MKNPVCRFAILIHLHVPKLSMYCYCHKESRIIDADKAPSQKQLLEWALQGHILGRDKSKAAKHLELWHAMCLKARGAK